MANLNHTLQKRNDTDDSAKKAFLIISSQEIESVLTFRIISITWFIFHFLLNYFNGENWQREIRNLLSITFKRNGYSKFDWYTNSHLTVVTVKQPWHKIIQGIVLIANCLVSGKVSDCKPRGHRFKSRLEMLLSLLLPSLYCLKSLHF